MVTVAGDVKLLDFGLAKPIQPAARLDSAETTVTLPDRPSTATGHIVGTVAYMSPEQAQGKRVDARSDIFSFGTLFYEILTARRPFGGQDALSILTAVLRDEPIPPSRISAVALPAEAERIVLRCLRKDPDRRFQTTSDLHSALEDLRQEMASGTSALTPARHRGLKSRWLAAAGLAATAVVLAISSRWWQRAPKPIEPRTLRQVTFDGGIAATPAISPDGKLLAFASDRADPGNLDIWLRQTAGGGLIRLTSQAGVEYNPQFSPDGTKLYYLKGDQSIFEISALGGPARKVAENAGPFTVSSKGELAFSRLGFAARPGAIMIIGVPGAGAEPEPWQPTCRSLPRPAWSPDGSRLFFIGECGARLRSGFLAPRQSGAAEAVLDEPSAAPSGPAPAWHRQANGEESILYARAFHLVRFGLKGNPAPALSGAGGQLWPDVSAAGDMIFTQAARRTGVWRIAVPSRGFPADATPANVAEAIGHFSVSRDGETLVYGRQTSGSGGELVVRKLATGEERVFAEHELLGVSVGSIWPQVAPDGKQIIYRLTAAQTGHYLLKSDTGEIRRIATMDRFQLASDWSVDGKRVLGECPPPRLGICELDPASGDVKPLLIHSTDQLLYPSWSWDARSIVFMRRPPGGISAIWIAPVSRDGAIGAEENWVEISPPQTDNSRPRFSPDGAAVYYVTGRGGQRLLAAQKIEKTSHRAIGEPVLVVRAPVEVTALTGGAGPYPLIAVTPQRVFYSTYHLRGNLWMTRLD